MRRIGRSIGCCVAALAAVGACRAAACSTVDELRGRLDAIDRRGTMRVALFGGETPERLLDEALRRIGEPTTVQEGDRAFGMMVAELPVESLWKAINDEEHHDGYLPVRHSEVVDGSPRGESRLLFQYFQKWGIGRWWVSRVTMNRSLFRESGGRMWELSWTDEMDRVDRERPPIREISAKLTAIRSSRGSWLFVPLGDECTWIEHFSSSRPGGAAGVVQHLLAGRALRRTFEGLVRMAVEHVPTPHPDATFVRPDGAVLSDPVGEGSRAAEGR